MVSESLRLSIIMTMNRESGLDPSFAIKHVFKLRLGALIPMSVCLLVGWLVGRSVCLSSKNYKNNYKTLQNLPNHQTGIVMTDGGQPLTEDDL